MHSGADRASGVVSARTPLFLALIGLAAGGATCKGDDLPPAPTKLDVPTAAEPAAAPTPAVPELEGVALSRVPPPRRADAIRLLQENFCYCGCARTLAGCLSDREACSCVECSERVTEFILGAFEQGMGTAQVESMVVEVFSEAYNAAPQDFDLADQPTLGPADAAHTLVEFADFRCGHCKDAYGELTAFVKGRSDVRLAYYYFPLRGFGEISVLAARAAEAARRQGEFWAMAQRLYTYQTELSESALRDHARAVGLDMDRFEADLADPSTLDAVMADKKVGTQVGVEGTPTIFVDGRPLGLPHGADGLRMRLAMEDDRTACD